VEADLIVDLAMVAGAGDSHVTITEKETGTAVLIEELVKTTTVQIVADSSTVEGVGVALIVGEDSVKIAASMKEVVPRDLEDPLAAVVA